MAEARGARDPAFLLYLGTLATLPIARPALFQIGPTGVQVTDVLLGLTYVAWIARAVRGRTRLRPDLLLGAALAYVGALGLSIGASERPTLTAAAKLVALAAYVALPWLSAHVIGDEGRLRLAVRAWLVGTAVAVAVGLAGVVAFLVDRDGLVALGCSYGRIPAGPYPRVCLPFRNPNLLASYLTASIPLLLACGAVLLRRPWGAVAVAACAAVALLTLSSGIGGFALAVAVVVWVTARGRPEGPGWLRRVVVAGGLITALAFAVATIGHAVPRGQGHVPLGDRDFHFLKGPRVHTWLSAAATVRDHPLLGVGYGRTVARTPGRDLTDWLAGDLGAPLREPPDRPRFAEAHNTWLNVAGQAGLVGLAALLVLLYAVARRLTTRPLPADPPLDRLPLAVVAGVVGVLLFHGLFMGAEEARHLWALFGLGAAADAVRRRAEISPGTRPAS